MAAFRHPCGRNQARAGALTAKLHWSFSDALCAILQRCQAEQDLSDQADVWRLARRSGLVVDVVSKDGKAAPKPVLDNDYEIRPCHPEPHEDPAQNKADAERDGRRDLQFIL